MLSAREFMAKHERELEESEEFLSSQMLAAISPQGFTSLKWIATPSEARDEWLKARAALPGNQLLAQLRHYWLIRLLRAAKRENSPQAYRELLESFLIKLGAEPPEKVFLRPRKPRGAPRKASTKQIYQIWQENGRPTWSEVAFLVYRGEYTRSDSEQRKRLRDRCARAVKRYEERYVSKKYRS